VFTDEFKAGAAGRVLDEGKTIAQVARDLDLVASVLRTWVVRARATRDGGKSGLTTEERAELAQNRREVRVTQIERDILRKSRGLLREGERARFAFIGPSRVARTEAERDVPWTLEHDRTPMLRASRRADSETCLGSESCER
jgi:transposase-like protein